VPSEANAPAGTYLAARGVVEAPAVAAPPLGAPIVLEPAKLAVAAPDEPAPQKPDASRPAAPHEDETVFSKFSTLLGSAANATGDGINFMIDLPGRALHQGRGPSQGQGSDAGSAAAPQSVPPMQYAGS
jgi:hypothetical protein